MKQKKCVTDSRRLRKPVWAVVLVFLLCVVFGFAYIRYAEGYRTFQPPAFEMTVADGLPENAVNFQQLAVREGFLVGVDVQPVCRDGVIYLNAANFEGNTVRFLVKICKGEEIIAQTGIIEPGRYVESVACTRTPEEGEDVFMKFVAYEADGWHSEGVANVICTASS